MPHLGTRGQIKLILEVTSLESKEHRIKGFLKYCTNVESLTTNRRIALELVFEPHSCLLGRGNESQT